MTVASKIVTMELPHGRDWLYYPDLNILALAPHLDCAGRERAINELSAAWRKDMCRHLALVRDDDPPRVSSVV